MFLRLRSLSHPRRAQQALLAAGAFVLGIASASVVAPAMRGPAPVVSERAEIASAPSEAELRARRISGGRTAYSAEVLRVLDGDTFEARVHLWPGLDITTRVRLRGIDAPEMRARCSQERSKAEAARDALATMLAQGRVGITDVTLDKYGGRVIAGVSTQRTANVSDALLTGGFARRYAGGRRETWCDASAG